MKNLCTYFLPIAFAGCLTAPVIPGERDELDKLADVQLHAFGTTDLLLVVDNSASMGDKQTVLAETLALTLSQWACTDEKGQLIIAKSGPTPPDATQCHPLGEGARIGLITTDIGATGTDCGSERRVGAGQLVARVGGSLYFDESDWDVVETPKEIARWVKSVGEQGCGFEAPLEAAYRFLIDPNPPNEIVVGADGNVQRLGTNETILAERSTFLRPGSALLVVILTDEDDCSIVDEGLGLLSSSDNLPRPTEECSKAADDPCCRSCATKEDVPPEGCRTLSEDSNCMSGTLTAMEDNPNLRCYNQKQRFGVDLLFPTSRYVEGFTSRKLTLGQQIVDNPLFAHGRTPDTVRLAIVGGIPSQLLSTEASLNDPESLDLLSSAELAATGAWARLSGDALDPHLRESVEPRPELASPASARSADPIHGHEYDNPHRAALQLSCTFPLPEPLDCADNPTCDCSILDWEDGPGPLSPSNPVCQAADESYGTVQYFARAYPPKRLLEVAQQTNAVLASTCPKTLDAELRGTDAYGYVALLKELLPWIGVGSPQGLCLVNRFPGDDVGRSKCRLVERLPAAYDCSLPGRKPARPDDIPGVLPSGTTASEFTVCEVEPVPGDPFEPATPAYKCANDFSLPDDMLGWCLVDPEAGLGDPELVSMCPENARRRVRLAPQTLGLSLEAVYQQALFLVCTN